MRGVEVDLAAAVIVVGLFPTIRPTQQTIAPVDLHQWIPQLVVGDFLAQLVTRPGTIRPVGEGSASASRGGVE